MNQREGGAADLFKIDTAFDFIDLFLEIAFDPEKANLLAANLRTHREQLNRLPALNLELDFLAALRTELEVFATESHQLREAEEAHAHNVQEAQRAHGALCASIERKQALKSAAEEKQESLKKERNEKSNEAERYRKYSEGYNRLHLKLAHEEAQANAESCRAALSSTEKESAMYKAATLLKKLTTREADIAALQEQKALADETRRPAEDSLKPLGAVLRALITKDVAILNKRLNEQVKIEHDALTEGDSARLNRDEAIRRQSEIRTRVTELKKAIDAHDRRRAELRDDDKVLYPRESASEAISRWEIEQQNTTKRLSELTEEQLALGGDVESLTNEISARSSELSRLEERYQHDEHLAAEGAKEAASLKADGVLRDAVESDDPDLDFSGLPERLATMHQRTQTALIDLKLDGAEDERSKQWIEEHSLLPPTREVVKLIETLHADGAKSAVSAYKFLADNLPRDQAEECISTDPARFSGAMLQSSAEFETLRAKVLRTENLSQPVVVSLTGRHEGAAANDRVVLSAAPGCYSYSDAQAALPAIQARHDERRRHTEAFNRRIHEIEATVSRLNSFRERFGAGRLRLMQQALEAAKSAIEVKQAQLSQFKSVRGQKRTLIVALTSEGTELQGQLIAIERALVKLRTFQRDYGEPFSGWETEHRTLQTEAHEVETSILEVNQRLEKLAGIAREAAERVRALSDEASNLNKEVRAIRFDTGEESPATEGILLEQARSRYDVAVQQFDRQFGTDQISGQLIQLEKEREAEELAFREAAKDLDERRISNAAAQPGLTVCVTEADAAERAARAAFTLAQNEVTLTKKNLPGPQSYKTGADLPPGEPEPSIASEALEKANAMKARKSEVDKAVADLSTQLDELKAAFAALQGSINTRSALRDSLKEYATAGEHDDFLPPSDEETSRVVGELRDRLAAATRERDTRAAKLDILFSKFSRVIHHERFSSLVPAYKTKMAHLERDELRKECDSYLLQIDVRQTTIRKDIEQCKEHKKIIVSNLEAVTREVASLLRRAQRESMLPKTLKGWAEQPFLRVHFELPDDAAEMQVKLDVLVEKLVREEIPTGLGLTCLAFHEIAPSVRVTLLKPESNLRPDRHEITAFGGFSGGEKLTAAILLYCTLVRLRSQSRGWMKSNSSAGVLILDNPVGISSKEDFIRLQLDLARQMGVQLLYTTGVNDLGALSVLPLRVRLRNQTRDRISGDLLVTPESATSTNAEGVVEGVRLAWRA